VAVALKAQQKLRAEIDCQATAKAHEHVKVKSQVDEKYENKGFQNSTTVVKRD
jgi:hypothetical protein